MLDSLSPSRLSAAHSLTLPGSAADQITHASRSKATIGSGSPTGRRAPTTPAHAAGEVEPVAGPQGLAPGPPPVQLLDALGQVAIDLRQGRGLLGLVGREKVLDLAQRHARV